MKFVLMLTLLMVATGCLKTADQVRREQRLENMSQQLSDSQNIVADLTVMLKNLQTQIDGLNGKVEELQHGQANNTSMKQIQDTLAELQTQMNTLSEGQKTQASEMQQQRAFIEKVTESLGKMGATRDSSTKKKPKDAVAEAHGLIKKKKYGEARAVLESLVNDPAVNAADRNKALHGLGVLEFEQKNYEQGLVFFSKIYTKYPRSSLAPSSLMYIGRSLGKLGKKEEAKQAFQEIESSYPQSPQAKQAKQEVKKL